MKYLGVFLIVALIAVAGTQCTPKDPKAKIQSMEEKVRSESFTFDQKGIQLIEELIIAYTDYAEANKYSDEAPEYLYKAAEFSLNLNKPVQALEFYNQIIYQYPDFHKAPECLFLLAFIYENHMLNLGKAKELYETFIERYPDHDFADDAAISIQNMGKSPEELIREFEANAL
ncbi:MAG: tetratricopeptide repeat protein [Bacteroidales bacterium]